MFCFFRLCFGTLVRLLWSRHSLLLENLVLRQQLVVLKHRHPRPKLDLFDKLFWLLVRRCWSGWKQALLVVTPETVVRWHRAGFRWYWTVISQVRKPVGRKPASKEVRDLIVQMMAESPSWGAPRIHGRRRILVSLSSGRVEEATVKAVIQQDNETRLIVDYGYDETATVSLWQVRRE